MRDKRIKIEIKWDVYGTELTFIEHVELPPTATQPEFLKFCIETVERAKQLGYTEPQPLPRPSETDEIGRL